MQGYLPPTPIAVRMNGPFAPIGPYDEPDGSGVGKAPPSAGVGKGTPIPIITP